MDLQALANTFLAGGLMAAGWFCRTIYTAVTNLEERHEKLALKVAEEYTPLSRFDATMRDINAKLDRILDALAHKVDR